MIVTLTTDNKTTAGINKKNYTIIMWSNDTD